jgi:hypothetical protein
MGSHSDTTPSIDKHDHMADYVWTMSLLGSRVDHRGNIRTRLLLPGCEDQKAGNKYRSDRKHTRSSGMSRQGCRRHHQDVVTV